MGVPAFFRWLSRKYPSVIVYCVEEKRKVINNVEIPVDSSKPNPNGAEFDNLYLDMNGIIHPCTHPEDKPAPKNEDEMMVAIFECIDRLFSIVRPRKLLYMAIDGVAPRAKMNQQRSRRFRASKEATEKVEEITRLREELLAKGAFLPAEKPKEDHFDSNCITPGTPFMARLSACLHYYVHDRLNNDPGWKGIKVILSDANVPGEGEHKIMDYIRKQRGQPDHDPNTRHCLCGADADLIMLGLATHEPNFTIIREEFRPNKPRPCDICSQVGHDMKDCVGIPKPLDGVQEQPSFGEETPFIFVCLNILREYLERELAMPGLPFKYDFERAVDDWVFMCFFVGNDFLPHLPSLEIREGAIDRLVNLYKDCVYKTGGYITDSGNVNLNRVQVILNELGKVEDEIFKKRQQTELMFRERDKRKKQFAQMNSSGRPSWTPGGQFAPTPLGLGQKPTAVQNARQEAFQGRMQGYHTKSGGLESMLRPEGAGGGGGGGGSASSSGGGVKRKHEVVEEAEEEDNDEVRLWEDGFKDRYYESKFDVDKNNVEFRVKVGHQYVRGLCWVLRYYYQGCASWKWYFPYHYAPFASDFIDVGDLSSEFEKDTVPFRPLEQLMGVFPAASSSHVPKPWAKLMSDPFSPIIDFYPIDFKIDLNGKKFAWQGVALLPFVDEKRLFRALEPYYDKLSPAEKMRNIRGDDRLYLGRDNSGYTFVNGLYRNQVPANDPIDITIDGMRGKVLLASDCVDISGSLTSPVRGLSNVEDNTVLCVRYRDPVYVSDYVFKAKRLKGAVDPPRVLKPGDLTSNNSNNWRPRTGFVQQNQRASLDQAGHRMLNHYNQNNQNHNRSASEPGRHYGGGGGGGYNQVPPPFYSSGGGGGGNRGWGGNRNDYNNSYNSNQSYGYQARNYNASSDRRSNWQNNQQNQQQQQSQQNWHHNQHNYQPTYSTGSSINRNSNNRGGGYRRN